MTLPDGSIVPRLPGFHHWMWDGAFCGSIDFRWQPGTTALPPHCPGHIGYAVVPWKRGRGCATLALRLLLPEARALGLDYVELTTHPENHASRRVIEANGGVLVERFTTVPQLGSVESLRFRIHLQPPPRSDVPDPDSLDGLLTGWPDLDQRGLRQAQHEHRLAN